MANFWDELAGAWEQWHAFHAALTAPVTAALIEAAGVAEGMRVLDLACGAGDPTLALAERVGPDGWVVGADGSTSMLEAAARFAGEEGIENVEWRQVDAVSLPFEDASFDAATCRFGLMFMPIQETLSEVRRVLREGGHFALAAWGDPAQPYFSEFDGIIARFFGWPVPRGGEPGLFQFSAPDVLSETLTNAGFSDVRAEVLTPELCWPGLAESYVASRLAFAPQLAAALSGLPGERQAELREALLASARNRADQNGVTFGGSVVVASGAR